MSYDKVKQAKARTVGTKQTKKAIEQGKVLEVYIAKDADQHVTNGLITMCQDRNITIQYVDSMKDLGKACGIEVGAATVGILKM